MVLHNPKGIPERIEVFGDIGTRKTSGGLDICKWAQNTDSDARFYWIDTDFALQRMLTEGDDYIGLNNIHYSECTTWPEILSATQKYLRVIRSQDWLMVDIMSETWPMIQSWYSQQIYGEDKEDHFMEVRKRVQDHLAIGTTPKHVQDFSGDTDWKYINGNYFKWRDSIVKHSRFNLYVTAKSKQIEKRDSEHTFTYYGNLGYKPEGQKDVEGLMHSVFYLRFDGDRWFMTTVKDRKRERVNNVQIRDFVLNYLVPIAGWKLK